MNVTLPIAAILATFVVARLRFKKGEKADSAPVVVPAPEEEEACETEFAAPEVTAGAVSEYVDAARPRQSERRILGLISLSLSLSLYPFSRPTRCSQDDADEDGVHDHRE